MKRIKTIYIIGALKNWKVVQLAKDLEQLGFEPFADWITPSPLADKFLLKYAKQRGWTYKQALNSYAARHVFEFDKHHIDRCDAAVMLAPCGKSGHIELGYFSGAKKPCFILFEKEPKRFDVMLRFANDIFFSKEELFNTLTRVYKP